MRKTRSVYAKSGKFAVSASDNTPPPAQTVQAADELVSTRHGEDVVQLAALNDDLPLHRLLKVQVRSMSLQNGHGVHHGAPHGEFADQEWVESILVRPSHPATIDRGRGIDEGAVKVE
ncbi:hypothetical protein PGB27_24050 [Actinomycetospora sp. DW7H6]|uniref:Uncharacterized protein n=1 Tax=Actinomycetospora lemnae TaxID=3019891 RepID=A0ABT5SZY7_9PSEU|nr:hypothetical protein [Actinomycetospora sp. DW7H6]MDD7968427.1 hypothetical protein [Actinomycetospora sp. DW7H6]